MFFGVYQQLQQNETQGSGQMGTSALGSEPALIEWPASFEKPWVPYPQSPSVQWSLQVEGHVAQPRTYQFNTLNHLPMTYQLRRVASNQGWSFKTEWHGVLIKHLMADVSVQAGVRFLEIEDIHGNKSHFPIGAINKSQAMLTLYQGSHTLSPWHGGPVRFMAFEYNVDYCLGQVKAIRFLTKLTKEQKLHSDSQLLEAGSYYAFDTRETITHKTLGEIH
jgi:DMSO/TMAO reductase YedYZ molybdopterin-dependent catalytic subunit